MFGFHPRVGRRVGNRAALPSRPIDPLEPRRLLAGVTVTTTDDLTDGDTSSITALLANPGPTGISLREALAAANNTPGADTVGFSIPGGGVAIIAVNSGFLITDPVTIDGFTQGGSSPNTLPLGNNGVQNVEIRGENVFPTSATGLSIISGADGTVIRGLSMTGWTDGLVNSGTGISVDASNVSISGNRIGIDPLGAANGNDTGVRVGPFASGVVIGGTTPAERNVISANGVEQIDLQGHGGFVLGNFIGSNVAGTGKIEIGNFGVQERGTGNVIGGPGVASRNIMVGQTAGIFTRGTGGFIAGNFIGLGPNGEPLGNRGDGVRILTSLASERIIRVGSEKDAFNAPVIAYNAAHGINIAQGNVAIGQVSIHNNAGAGINSPPLPGQLLLTSAVTTTTGTTVSGTVSGGSAGDSVLLEFFGNTAGGEQEAFLGSERVTLDQNGQATFSSDLAACGLPFVVARASGVTTTILGAEELFAMSTPIANITPPVLEITNTNGSGPGSIVAAFTAASQTPGPDVILLNIPGTGFVDITPTAPLIPMFGQNNNVLFEGRGQRFGSVAPRTFINVNNGLGTFNGSENNTVAGVGFFNISGRAVDFAGGNNTLIHSTVGLGAAEQELGVSSVVQSDVVRILGGTGNRVVQNVLHAARGNATIAVYGGTDHFVQFNRIGITQSGLVLGGTPTTNNRVGVVINGGMGTEVSDNTIAGMSTDAIKVGEFGQPGGAGHTLIRNSMLLNAALGIDLGDDGVTLNDGPGDPDTGPNGLQNHPVITTAEQVASGTRVTGTFVSGLNMVYAVEAFATSASPAINIDEGARSLGILPLATDGSGSVPFDLTFPGLAVFGERILLTATAPDGSTSEFSVSVPLVDNLPPTVNSGRFEFEQRPTISYRCSEDAIVGIDPTDVLVERLLPGGALEVAATFLLDDQDTIRYILSLPGGGPVPDGNYRCTFQPNAIQDAAGNSGPPPGFADGANPRVVDFFIFAGDANRDRAINLSDFSILAGNFNEEGFFSDGDFNYSGQVEIGDFAILAGKFNTTLPEPVGRTRPIASPLPAAARVGGQVDLNRRLFTDLIDSAI
jgi:hypothetical protein